MSQEPDEFEQLDIQEQLDKDFTFFVNFVHKRLNNAEFEWHGYNKKIATELLNVYQLKYRILIINIPPRLGKTILLTYFNAWTIYKNARVYNNYYTYSDLLVNRMYSTTQRIFKIPEVMEGAKATYKREKEDFSNSEDGGLFAQTTLGQVTGFGCGRKENIHEFNGFLGLDDPHKAQDSIIKIASANRAIKSAVLNRKNNHLVPIVLIMQRLHKLDATGFLMEFYSEWFENGTAKLLKIPAEINGKPISSKEYPISDLLLEKKNDPDYYWTQLMQEPQSADGKYFKNKHFDITAQSISDEKSFTTISFNPEDTSEPIVFVAFRKEGKNAVILDYQEESVDADSFFASLKDFCELNRSKKIYIPKSIITKTAKQELKPYKVEEVEESTNIGLSAFYAVGLLKEGKIKLKDDELSEAFKEELKLYPNSKRDYVMKAMINVLEILFVKSGGRMARSV
ncbi:MAG: hypothetical protein COB61_011545 [Thiotrichales bacterium]|nr:hypothetical protein [Thiotrichales bacterium]